MTADTSLTFGQWLGTQARRQDSLGVFARARATARCCPDEGSLSDVLEHFNDVHTSISDAAYEALNMAITKWQLRRFGNDERTEEWPQAVDVKAPVWQLLRNVRLGVGVVPIPWIPKLKVKT